MRGTPRRRIRNVLTDGPAACADPEASLGLTDLWIKTRRGRPGAARWLEVQTVEPDDPAGPAPTWRVVDNRNEALLGGLNPEEAERIAACLNLARGIPTEELVTHAWQVR